MTLSNDSELITDEQTLESACYQNSQYPIATYDDGYGRLWISRNSIGINGIVRARTWEDAYGICEDEFFPEADETIEQIVKEYGFKREHKKVVKDSSVLAASEHCNAGERFERYPEDYPNGKLVPEFVRWVTIVTPDADSWTENELFQEAYGFRPNGANVRDKIGHGIYSKDLNGDALDLLTPEMVAELEIFLDIEEPWEVIVGNIGSVYSGTDETLARATFATYKQNSIDNYGRAAGEDVTLMRNDEPVEEFFGTLGESNENN
jgi:hypothetical protein